VGAADPGRPGRLPSAGAPVRRRRPVPLLLARRPHALRAPLADRALLGWDAARAPTLRERLPADLRAGPSGPAFDALPFTSLYLTGDEWAAEIANRTMRGVMHIGWVPDGTGGYRGEMAVYVQPNGRFGSAYMAAIAPFRHRLVYPPMLREIGRRWRG
jgi:hypothetical protein